MSRLSQDTSGMDAITGLIPVHLAAAPLPPSPLCPACTVVLRRAPVDSSCRDSTFHIITSSDVCGPSRAAIRRAGGPVRANGAADVKRGADRVLFRGNFPLLASIKSS